MNVAEMPLYVPDSPAAVLSCVSKRMFCNPKIPGSKGYLGLFASGEDAFRRVFTDPEDPMILRPLSIVLQQYGAGGMQTFMAKNVPTLLARQTLHPLNPRNAYTAIQTKVLPSNQWQKEVEYVAQVPLASMQHFIVDFTRGSSWFGFNGLCDEEPCRRTCHSQACKQQIFRGN